MPKAKALEGASGFIVKYCGDFFRVPRGFAKGLDSVEEVAEKVAKHLDEVTTWPKGRLRERYLGRTPGKLSRTGQGVWRTMARAEPPKLFDAAGFPIDPNDFLDRAGNLRNLKRRDLDDIFVIDETGKRRPLSSCHMGHNPTDAVDYWTREGFARTPQENRQWMRDPANYEFEYGPDNLRRGRENQNRYANADPVRGADVPGT